MSVPLVIHNTILSNIIPHTIHGYSSQPAFSQFGKLSYVICESIKDIEYVNLIFILSQFLSPKCVTLYNMCFAHKRISTLERFFFLF